MIKIFAGWNFQIARYWYYTSSVSISSSSISADTHWMYVNVDECDEDMQQITERFGQIAEICSSSADERAEFMLMTFFAA